MASADTTDIDNKIERLDHLDLALTWLGHANKALASLRASDTLEVSRAKLCEP